MLRALRTFPASLASRRRGAVVSRAFGAMLLVGAASAARPAMAQPTRAALPGDTIVRLAVDSARVGGATVVFLLDAVDARIAPDGTGERTHRTVMQVIRGEGVSAVAERRFDWQPSRQDFRLDWVRVLRRDGTVVSDTPSVDQSGDATPSMLNPIYVDSRSRRISLAGVAAGTIVDVQYTLVDRAPWRPGDFLVAWSLTPMVPLRVSELRVSMPSTFAPRIRELNLTTARRETDSAGVRTITWRVRDPLVVRNEPFAPDSDAVRTRITVSAAQPWDSVTRWYDGLARSRYALDTSTARRLDALVRDAGTRDDTLQRLHRFVTQDVRYVSVSLGLGGFQPRPPAEVLATGYGDCKDKTTLFVAAARRWGIDARPVLLHLNGAQGAEPVSIARFNHAIVAVADGRGGYTYTDPTAATIPFGDLPVSYRGSFAVVVRPDGLADEVRLPRRAVQETGTFTRLEGTLRSDGRMDLRVQETSLGDMGWALRGAFGAPLDSTRRQAAMRALATAYLPDASTDSLSVFDGRDFTVTPRVGGLLRDGRGARPAGPVWLLHLPTPFRQVVANMARQAGELAAMPPRRLPIDAARIVGPRTTEIEYRVTLPDGWSATLPPPIVATSFFGRYESRYVMEGRTLVMRRRLEGVSEGIVAPERLAEVVAWMRAVAVDDLEFVTLTPAP
jgi:hypothetical protein